MSSLTGKDPKDTYKDLLQVSNSNSGIDATLRNVEDGEGTSSPLMLSEDSVEIESQLVLSVAEGTAPMSVTSTTTVTNLDSDTVDGSHAADFATSGHDHAGVYSEIGHDHAGVYSEVGHDHAGVYSEVGHDHSGTYSEIGHDHSGEDINPDNVILGAADDIVLARDSAGVAKFTGGGDGTNWGGLSSGNIEIHGLDHVEAPVISNAGTPGATTYSYVITALLRDGSETAATHIGTTNTGNATLDGTNYNIITWAPITGALNYNVYRYAGGDSQGLIVGACSSPQNDIGLPATTTWPTQDTTGSFSIYSGSTRKLWLTPDLGGGTKEGIRIGDPGAAYLDMGIYGGAVMATFGHGAYRWETRWRHTDVTSGAFKFYSDTASQLDSASIGEIQFATNMCGSSDTQIGLSINNIWNQTGTSSGTDLLLYRTESALGSGSQLFIDAQVGGTSKFSVDNTGTVLSPMVSPKHGMLDNGSKYPHLYIKGGNSDENVYASLGGSITLLPGVCVQWLLVSDYTKINPGDIIVIRGFESFSLDPTQVVLTEGVDWDAETSNEVTAGNIKDAIDAQIQAGTITFLRSTYLHNSTGVFLYAPDHVYHIEITTYPDGCEWYSPFDSGGARGITIGGGQENPSGPNISGSPRFSMTLSVNHSDIPGKYNSTNARVFSAGYYVCPNGDMASGLIGAESTSSAPDPLIISGFDSSWSGASGSGSNVFIKPGEGSASLEVLDYTGLTGKIITIRETALWNEDIEYTIQEGVDFDAITDNETTAANIVDALNGVYWYFESELYGGTAKIYWNRDESPVNGGVAIYEISSNADPTDLKILHTGRGSILLDGHVKFVDWENPDGNGLHTDVGLQRASRMVLQVTNGGDGGVTTSGSLKTSTVYNEYSNWIGEQRTGSTDATVGVLSGQTPGTTAPIAAGGDVHLMGGIGKKTIQVVDYSHGSMANSTITVTENGTPVVLTEGSEWDSLTSNDYTATSIANAINMNCSYVFTAEASGAYVYIADMHDVVSGELRTLKIAKSANDAGMTVIDGRQGNMSVEHLMQAASGDEVAFEINYEVDKAAGNDTGLLISQTDTSSPGTSDQIRTESDGNWHFRADNTGRIYVSGTNNAIWASIYGGEGGIYIGGSSGGNLRFDTQHLGPFYDTYRADSSGIDLGATYPICWASAAGLFSLDTLDTGLVRASAGVVKFTNGSTGYGSTSMSNLTLTALSTPDAPVITNGGTPGATAYSYKVVAKLADGSKTLASSAGSTATGNATLDADNYNIITWSAVTGAHTYDVYRSASAGNPASTGLLFTSVSSPQHDHGEAAVGAEPTANTTGVIDGPNFDVTNSGVVSAAAFKAQTSAYFMPYINGSYMDAYDTNDIRFRLGANGRLYIDGDLGIDMATGTQLTWESAAGSSPASRDIGLARIAAGVLKVTDASTGAGTISAAGLNVGAYTAVSDGKIAQTVALNDATGNEYAQVHTITVNKLTSGEAGGIRMDITDTASPDRIAALDVYRGGDRECLINTGADNYPSMYVKWYTKMSGGWACFTADTQADSGKYCTMFANGTATSGALAAGDVGIMSKGNGNKGFKFMDDQVGGYTYAPIVTYAVRLGEKGGSDLVDAGIMRYGTGVARIFTGDLNSISTGKLMVTDLVAPDGSPDALTIANDGNLTANVSLTVAASAKVVWDTNVYEYADTVTLTDESDTPIFEIAIADGDMIGGKFSYTICASDGTDHQAISGDASFAAVRKAGTPETYHVDIDEHLGTDSTAVSTGTLTDAFSIAGASGKITVGCTANSSLAGATITLRYKLTLHSSKAVTKKT